MTSYGDIIVDSCIISFSLNCIMQLKQFYNIATKVSSRKRCNYFWWSTWLVYWGTTLITHGLYNRHPITCPQRWDMGVFIMILWRNKLCYFRNQPHSSLINHCIVHLCGLSLPTVSHYQAFFPNSTRQPWLGWTSQRYLFRNRLIQKEIG